MGSRGIVVRDFAAADQVSVRALVLAGMRERWGAGFDESWNADLDDIARSYVEPGGEVVVVEVHGHVVATGTLVDLGDGVGQLVRMSVDQARRRTGLGRLVVDELVARARRRSLRAVTVVTDAPWADAVAFYAGCGFTEVDRDAAAVRFEMLLD